MPEDAKEIQIPSAERADGRGGRFRLPRDALLFSSALSRGRTRAGAVVSLRPVAMIGFGMFGFFPRTSFIYAAEISSRVISLLFVLPLFVRRALAAAPLMIVMRYPISPKDAYHSLKGKRPLLAV